LERLSWATLSRAFGALILTMLRSDAGDRMSPYDFALRFSRNETAYVIKKRENCRHPGERRDPRGRAKRDGFVIFILTRLRIDAGDRMSPLRFSFVPFVVKIKTVPRGHLTSRFTRCSFAHPAR
jgi:hypothetical protein